MVMISPVSATTVSYTHLDVYKRQLTHRLDDQREPRVRRHRGIVIHHFNRVRQHPCPTRHARTTARCTVHMQRSIASREPRAASHDRARRRARAHGSHRSASLPGAPGRRSVAHGPRQRALSKRAPQSARRHGPCAVGARPGSPGKDCLLYTSLPPPCLRGGGSGGVELHRRGATNEERPLISTGRLAK